MGSEMCIRDRITVANRSAKPLLRRLPISSGRTMRMSSSKRKSRKWFSATLLITSITPQTSTMRACTTLPRVAIRMGQRVSCSKMASLMRWSQSTWHSRVTLALPAPLVRAQPTSNHRIITSTQSPLKNNQRLKAALSQQLMSLRMQALLNHSRRGSSNN